MAIDTLCADLADWAPPAASVDAVVLVFVHLRPALRTLVHQRLARALVPGGWLLIEAFHPEQLGRPSGGPKEADMLFTHELLRADFAGLLDEVVAWQGEVQLDEGPGHQGAGVVTRWLGRPPT
ncbi:MAG: hypothetical protein CFE45_03875 [Burkholderiales bacterium PBB5]|nr:MAG: hypothetical protein CFE45_03875 [Burkholderiales bacterium PBB5]